MASRDVRVRVRPSVVRVRISEPALRTVVRVAAENPQLKYPYAYLPRDWQALFFLSRRSTFTSAKIAWGIEPQDDLLGCRRKRDFFCCFFFITLLFLLFYFFILSRALFLLLP